MKLKFVLSVLFFVAIVSHGPSMPPDPWDPCCSEYSKYCPPCK